jgi:hypothetical protein
MSKRPAPPLHQQQYTIKPIHRHRRPNRVVRPATEGFVALPLRLPYIAMTIVSHAYPPKRARREKAEADAITGPIIVTASSRTRGLKPRAVLQPPSVARLISVGRNPARQQGF